MTIWGRVFKFDSYKGKDGERKQIVLLDEEPGGEASEQFFVIDAGLVEDGKCKKGDFLRVSGAVARCGNGKVNLWPAKVLEVKKA